MCGITGFWLDRAVSDAVPMLQRMNEALAHRGPDGSEVYFDPITGVGLAHRRLAVVDLSPGGRQPMTSPSGRYTITFNGEIYNFQRIRADLEDAGYTFHSHSDTEVMLVAFERWGVEAATARFIGQFAFVLWDRVERRLMLCRDRLGKKPLYYYSSGGQVAFASELNALKRLRGVSLEVDRDALSQYLRFQYVPAPKSIYRNVWKLSPGEIVSFSRTDSGLLEKRSLLYWSAQQIFADAAANPYRGSQADAEAEVEHLLQDAVMLRMISDVPLGAFLSGGIDSSLVVALMQKLGSKARTFSIGFDDAAYDESEHAARVAAHLSTEHTKLVVTSAMALDVVPQLPRIYDEPFGDSSQIPTFLVAKLAREHVTVALSGDGGDELFCGYNRYLWWRQLWPGVKRVPYWLRRSVGEWVLSRDSSEWDSWIGRMQWLLPKRMRHLSPGMLVRKGGESLLARGPEDLYMRLVSHWRNPDLLAIGGKEPSSVISEAWPRGLDECTARMSMLDIMTYLPDDILVKVDRASMASSLEARCPLLDHRIVELAARLPMGYKIQNGKGKALLRSILYRHVPQSLVDRPKTGFGIPLAAWLRGPLREWAESLLNERRLRAEGYLDAQLARAAWSNFQNRGEDLHYQLWTLLMFQAWLDEWK